MHALKHPTATTLACLALLGAGGAMAQSNPWYLGISQTVNHQSNMLRAIDGAVFGADQSRSDTLYSTALIGGIDQPLGRQRIFGSATLRSDRYAKNDVYDNQGWTLRAGLDWQTVERLSGSLNLSSSRSLASFNLQEIGLLRQRNSETATGLDGIVRLGVAGPWLLELGAGTLKVENSLQQAQVQSRNYRQDTLTLGARWRPSAALTLGLAVRQTDGKYPQFRALADGSFEVDRFRRRDVDVSGTWRPSGASQFDMRLSTGSTRYDLASQRDFSGVTGTLSWNWVPTGKLQINTRYSRDTGQDSYAVTVFDPRLGFVPGNADYSRIQDVLRIRAEWTISPKFSVNASLSEADRELVRTLPPTGFGDSRSTGGERISLASVGARWAPWRNVLFGCDLNDEKRKGSGQLGTGLSTRGVSCFGQVTLQ